jgi:hypothetical protein
LTHGTQEAKRNQDQEVQPRQAAQGSQGQEGQEDSCQQALQAEEVEEPDYSEACHIRTQRSLLEQGRKEEAMNPVSVNAPAVFGILRDIAIVAAVVVYAIDQL